MQYKMSYLWDESKPEKATCQNQNTTIEHSRNGIQVARHYEHYKQQYNENEAGDTDQSCNKLGVIQNWNINFPGMECQDDAHYLQHS